MTPQAMVRENDLFSEALIRSYLDSPRFVERTWLWRRVETTLAKASCRLLLLTAEAGAGKTAFMAWLADQHGDWPRYFIRRDQRTPLEDGGARGFLEKVGFQLAARFPEAFGTDAVSISVSQVVGRVGPSGEVIGADVDRLIASPFYAQALDVIQQVKVTGGRVAGIKVGELVTDPNRISLLDLQRMALFAPAAALQKQGRSQPVVILVDALDELRYRPPGDTVLDLLTQCPELPANVRILVTSRSDDGWLDPFRSAQRGRLEKETIPEEGEDISRDLSGYGRALVAVPAVEAFFRRRHEQAADAKQAIDRFVSQAVAKAGGNLGYLDALGRAVDQAIERNDDEMLASALDLSSLPALIEQLLGHFLDLIWQRVQDKSVVVRDPYTGQQHFLAQWSELYCPILGILSIAYEMLSIEQIRRLGGMAPDISDIASAVGLLRQFLDGDGLRYRFYHASFPEFLTNVEKRRSEGKDRFAISPATSHERLVAACTELVGGKRQWSDRRADGDPYVLRHLVAHIQARLALARDDGDREQWARTAYAVVLDERFRAAQQKILGDMATTLADLRAVLTTALRRDDLVKVLLCAGTYRQIKHGLTVTGDIFAAIDKGDFEGALERSRHYAVVPRRPGSWERVLQLYSAWEASEHGDPAAVRQIMRSGEQLGAPQIPMIERLWDALLARCARTLERTGGDGRPASAWLAELAPGRDAETLLASHGVARPPDPTTRTTRVEELSVRVRSFGSMVDENGFDVEEAGAETVELTDPLVALAATDEGQAGIDQALKWVLPNQYARYRDIGLVAMGSACLAVPESDWVRPRLRLILDAALNREGVTFSLSLAAVLLEEARTRGLPAAGLSAHLEEAIAADDAWSTAMRAWSARAAGLFWQDKAADAMQALEEAGRQRTGFAGYGTLTLLSLADRCWEFGCRDHASESVWGTGQDMSLLKGAEALADRVRDPQFREERLKLARGRFRAWWAASTPDAKGALDTLSEIADADERGLYIDHVTARWASPESRNRDWIKELIPFALPNATVLDVVLGRFFGLNLDRLRDDDLAEAICVWEAHLQGRRP